MSIADSFYSFVNSQSVVADLHPLTIPANIASVPTAVYALDDDIEETLLEGLPSSLKFATFSLDVYDSGILGARAVAESFKAALTGHTGAFGSHTAGLIQKTFETETFEPDTKLHRVALRFRIGYR